MSSTLTQLSINLTRIILPINIFIGVIGNILNIIILTRRTLYKYASTHYFLALAINNLFGSSFNLVNVLLSDGYDIDLTTYSTISCKIIRYLMELCGVLSSFFIVLASIDRYFISSLNPTHRNLSNVKIAQRIIGFTTCFLALIYSNTPILIDLNQTDYYGCSIRPKNLYYKIYPIIQVLLSNIIAPVLMIVFGILAIYHTKQVHIHPVHITRRRRRTERQLSLMLLIQVSTHILLNLPLCITYIMLSFVNITAEIIFGLTICLYLQQFSYTTPFFLYIISGRVFRKEFKKLIYKILKHRVENQIQPVTNNQHTNVGDGAIPVRVINTNWTTKV